MTGQGNRTGSAIANWNRWRRDSLFVCVCFQWLTFTGRRYKNGRIYIAFCMSKTRTALSSVSFVGRNKQMVTTEFTVLF